MTPAIQGASMRFTQKLFALPGECLGGPRQGHSPFQLEDTAPPTCHLVGTLAGVGLSPTAPTDSHLRRCIVTSTWLRGRWGCEGPTRPQDRAANMETDDQGRTFW